MAEIEHYVDPQKKRHARFAEVKDQKLRLLPKDVQSAGKSDLTEITVGEAVAQVRLYCSCNGACPTRNVQGIVDNETLGYFLARVNLFLLRIGIDPSRLRFRQHMANEMAHYAADCWDAEISSSYGWIECVGCADRSAYDLTVHSAKTGKQLTVEESLATPVTTERWRCEFSKKVFGPHFKKDAKLVEDTVLAQDEARLECMASELKNGSTTVRGPGGQDFELTDKMITITRVKETQHSALAFCAVESHYDECAQAANSRPTSSNPLSASVVSFIHFLSTSTGNERPMLSGRCVFLLKFDHEAGLMTNRSSLSLLR